MQLFECYDKEQQNCINIHKGMIACKTYHPPVDLVYIHLKSLHYFLLKLSSVFHHLIWSLFKIYISHLLLSRGWFARVRISLL